MYTHNMTRQGAAIRTCRPAGGCRHPVKSPPVLPYAGAGPEFHKSPAGMSPVPCVHVAAVGGRPCPLRPPTPPCAAGPEFQSPHHNKSRGGPAAGPRRACCGRSPIPPGNGHRQGCPCHRREHLWRVWEESVPKGERDGDATIMFIRSRTMYCHMHMRHPVTFGHEWPAWWWGPYAAEWHVF